MRSGQQIRWGVIGLGVGNQHALTIMNDDRAQLVAVCDESQIVLEKASAGYGNVTTFTSAEEMLSVSELDAVAVASYDRDHAATIVACLERGIHVFAEKPLGVTQSDYRSIGRALGNNEQVRMTTNTLLRRSPRFAWVKNKIDSGYFGQIVHLQADYLYGRLSKLTHGWRGTDPEYSVTLGGTIHMVDLVLWLVGERPESVTAVGSNAGLRVAAVEGGAVGFVGDSLRIGLLSFPNGVTASVSANFGSVGPHFHRLEVYGSEATFMNLPTAGHDESTAPGNAGLLLRGRDPGTAQAVDIPYPAVPKGILIPEFNRAILGTGRSPIFEQEAMDAFAVCLALDESVRKAEPIAIDYEEVSARH